MSVFDNLSVNKIGTKLTERTGYNPIDNYFAKTPNNVKNKKMPPIFTLGADGSFNSAATVK